MAESDYRAAREAVASTFDEFLLEQEQPSSSNKDGPMDHQLVQEIYAAAKTSMLQHLERIVQPVSDQDYSDYVDQFHFVLENQQQDDDHGSRGAGISDTTLDVEDYDEFEIDDEELIDVHAWKDARELRSRVRTMSSRVQAIRERILQGSTDRVINTCLEPHLRDMRLEIVEDEDAKAADDQAVATMKVSLTSLSSLLQDPQWTKFPERIQSLQDTIEAIQKGSAPDRFLSQTEVAITGSEGPGSNNNISGSQREQDAMEDVLALKIRLLLEGEKHGYDFDGNNGDDENEKENGMSDMTAVDRLALFGQVFS